MENHCYANQIHTCTLAILSLTVIFSCGPEAVHALLCASGIRLHQIQADDVRVIFHISVSVGNVEVVASCGFGSAAVGECSAEEEQEDGADCGGRMHFFTAVNVSFLFQ